MISRVVTSEATSTVYSPVLGSKSGVKIDPSVLRSCKVKSIRNVRVILGAAKYNAEPGWDKVMEHVPGATACTLLEETEQTEGVLTIVVRGRELVTDR